MKLQEIKRTRSKKIYIKNTNRILGKNNREVKHGGKEIQRKIKMKKKTPQIQGEEMRAGVETRK